MLEVPGGILLAIVLIPVLLLLLAFLPGILRLIGVGALLLLG